jgi:hypothetical protein
MKRKPLPYWFRRPLTPLPRGLHPIVRVLFREMEKQHATISMVSERTGIGRTTIQAWRRGSTPKVADLTDCLQVIGYELRAVPRDGE